MEIAKIVLTAFLAVFASSGFWAFILEKYKRKDNKDNAQAEMLKGLGHDRIVELGEKYIQNGSVSKDEYENLHDYLFIPYQKLGGNGTAEKIMKEVDKLPIKN